jgi:uncharacterized membrane protein
LLGEEDEEELGFGVSGRLLSLVLFGIVLVFIGIIVVVLAMLTYGGSGSAGGVIFIGPFPIVFGAGPDATWLITISIIIAVIMIVLFWVLTRRR